MSNKDALRSAAFKNPERKRIKFSYNGCDFELLQPTVSIRKKILNKTKKDNPTLIDFSEWAAIYCTVEPGTNNFIFDETDLEAFDNMGMNGFLDMVSERIPELLNLVEAPKIESAE